MAEAGLSPEDALKQIQKEPWFNDGIRAFDNMSSSVNKTVEQVEKLQKSLNKKDVVKDLDVLEKEFNDIVKSANALKETKLLDGSTQSALTNKENRFIPDAFKKAKSGDEKDLKHLQELMKNYYAEVEKAAKKVTTTVNTEKDQWVKGATNGFKVTSQELSVGMKKFEADLNRMNLEERIKKITNVVSNLGMAASTLSILGNIGDIWNNENLSSSEKAL
jgi:F0F1-type ATP synthase membrane subunit b/b'